MPKIAKNLVSVSLALFALSLACTVGWAAAQGNAVFDDRTEVQDILAELGIGFLAPRSNETGYGAGATAVSSRDGAWWGQGQAHDKGHARGRGHGELHGYEQEPGHDHGVHVHGHDAGRDHSHDQGQGHEHDKSDCDHLRGHGHGNDHGHGHGHGHGHEHEDEDGHDDEHDHDHQYDHDHDHAHDHTARVEGTRLLVADGEGHEVFVIDLASGAVLGTFSTPGVGSRVYASASGQYGVAIDRDEDRVTILHSGLRLEDHGDHQDLRQEQPYVVSTLNVGRRPSHYWTGGDLIAIFNDQDGTIVVLDERLFGLSLDFNEIAAAQPDHGAAVVLGDYVLAGHLDLGRVDAYALSGERLHTFEGCPGLHGEASRGKLAVFGCADGVLVVRLANGELAAAKLENPPGAPEDARVGMLRAHKESPVVAGNFGPAVAIVDPDEQDFVAIELSSPVTAIEFDEQGRYVFALTRDGRLHAVDPMEREVIDTLEVLAAPDPRGPRPSLAVSAAKLYVSSPITGEVMEVAWHEEALHEERRLAVPGAPSGIAVLALPEGVIH